MIVKGLLIFHISLSILGIQTSANDNSATKAVDTFNQYLVTVSDGSPSHNGYAIVTITYKNGLPSALPIKQSHSFPNHIVSRACGNHISRCRELTIIRESDSSEAIFLVPLNDAIGVMKFEDIRGRLLHTDTHVLEYAHHQDCITITIVEFNGKPYSVCIDSESRIISCSVNLNSVNLTQSYLQCVSLADNSLARGNTDFSLISNFVNTGNDFFVFAVGDALYKYYPERATLNSIPSCTLPHTEPNTQLLFRSHTTVLFYYETVNDSIVVPFDTAELCWQKYRSRKDVDGLEYPCFNGYSVFVYPSHSAILFGRQEQEEGEDLQFGIIGTDFATGRCFGNSSHTSFIYTDALNGTFVLDIASHKNTMLLNSMCVDAGCLTPLLYQNQYIILRGREGVRVFSQSSYKLVMETAVAMEHRNLIGFFTGPVYKAEIGTNTSKVNGSNNKDWTLLSIAVSLIGFFLLLSLASVAIFLLWHRSRTRKRKLNSQRQPGGNLLRYRVINQPQNDGQSDSSQSDTGTTVSQERDVSPAPTDTVTVVSHDRDVSPATPDIPQNPDQDEDLLSSNSATRGQEDTPSTTSDPFLSDSPENTPLSSATNMNIPQSASLLQLYPDRGSLPPASPPTRQDRLPTLSTASSTTSVTTSIQGMSREHYTAAGASASQENVSMPSPVQVSTDQQHTAHSLKFDCSSVLTTELSGASVVLPSQNVQQFETSVVDSEHPGRPVSLPPTTRSSSSGSCDNPCQVDLVEPIPVSSSTPSMARQSLITPNLPSYL